MRPSVTRFIQSPIACSAVFSFACVASANLLLAVWLDRPGDQLRHGLLGLGCACAVFGALFLSLGSWSESGDSRPLRGLAFMAFLGASLGLLPPVTFLIGIMLSLVLGTQVMVG